MPKCKACGAEIEFIKTPAGKYMPCSAEWVNYKIVPEGDKTIVTVSGEVKKCTFDCTVLDCDGAGHIPHWKTCTHADKFRRGNKKL